MTIPIHCPKCGGLKPAPDQWAGKLVQCDDCGARFKIPAKGAERRKQRGDKPAARSSAARPIPAPKQPSQSSGASFPVQCDACGRQYQVPSELAGGRCQCLHCGAAVEVPFPLTDAYLKPHVRPPPEPQPPPMLEGPLAGLSQQELVGGPPVSGPTASPAPHVDPLGPASATLSGITLPRKKRKKTSPFSGVASLGDNPIVALVLANKLLTAVLVVYLCQLLVCLAVLASGARPRSFVGLIPGLVVLVVGFGSRTRKGDTAVAKAVCGIVFLVVAAICLGGFDLFVRERGPVLGFTAAIFGYALAAVFVLLIAGVLIGLIYLVFRLAGTFRVLGTLYLGLAFVGLVFAIERGWGSDPRSAPTADADAAASGSLQEASPPGDAAPAEGQTGLFAISDVPLPDFSNRPPPRPLTAGVEMTTVHLGVPAGRPGHADLVWVYTPPGTHAPRSLPCVLIAPAGSSLISGMRLASGDRPEHLPYVKAGFAVVAFELDGPLDNPYNRNDLDVRRAYRKFSAAKAGLVNARNAIEFVLQRMPEVDPDRIYAAGHSSAATLALLLAEHEPRIKACVAYAPAVDVLGRLGDAADDLAKFLPGSTEFLKRSSPITHAEHLDCPLFLFHARDDSNTRVEESIRLADKLRRLGKDVTLVTVPTGDHYDSMIDEGIPRGIEWLSSQARVGPSLTGPPGASAGRAAASDLASQRPPEETVDQMPVPWSVRPDAPPMPDRPYTQDPIMLGPATVQSVAFSRADVGRVVAAHRQTVRASSGRSGRAEVGWLSVHDLFTGDALARVDVVGDDYKLCDVSPGGKLAALFVGGSRERLEIWSLDDAELKFIWGADRFEGEQADLLSPFLTERTAFIEYAPQVGWAGFVDDERVATAAEKEQELAVWSLAEGRADYTRPTYRREGVNPWSPPFLTPGRRYLALYGDKMIRFLDSRTGMDRGTLTTGFSQNRWGYDPNAQAFSADGRYLAVAYPGHGKFDLQVWDLTDGSLETDISISDRSRGRLHWCGPQYLGMLAPQAVSDVRLIDLARGVVVWDYHLSLGGLAGTRQGGEWAFSGGFSGTPAALGRLQLPDPETRAQIERQLPIPRQFPVGPGATVSLQVGPFAVPGFPPDLAGQVRAHLAAAMESRGVEIADGAPVRLVAACATIEGDSAEVKITKFFSSVPKKTISVPVTKVSCRLAFLDGSAEPLWEATEECDSSLGIAGVLPEDQDPVTYLRDKGLESMASQAKRFFLETHLPRRLNRQPRYSRYKFAGLGSSRIDLKDALIGTRRKPRARRAPGSAPDLTRPQPGFVQGYVERAYVDLLADDEALGERLLWSSSAKRPSIGLRCGLGVQVRDDAERPEIHDVGALRRHTEQVGPDLFEGLQDRLQRGSFGQWPPAPDPRFDAVALLGSGLQTELLEAAGRQRLDFVVLINLTTRVVGTRREEQTLIRIRLIDGPSGETLWASKSLNLDVSSSVRDSENDPEGAVAELFEQVDRDFSLAPMPELRPEHVQTRLGQLDLTSSQLAPQEALPLLVELRYYQAKGLISTNQVIPLYDAILGEGRGRVLAGGGPGQRRQLVRAWLSGDESR